MTAILSLLQCVKALGGVDLSTGPDWAATDWDNIETGSLALEKNMASVTGM